MGFKELFCLVLVFLVSVIQPVEGRIYYYGSWYLYLIIVFVVIAISSCIGACIRYKRNQAYMEAVQQRQGITVAVAGNANQGYTPGTHPSGYPPYGSMPQPAEPHGPPSYESTQYNTQKDPNMPPAYEEAMNYPGGGNNQNQGAQNNTPTAPYSSQQPPYPTQQPPYPTQQPPYPTQQPPYPTQQPPSLTQPAP